MNLHPAGMLEAGEALDLPLALGAAAVAAGHLTAWMLHASALGGRHA